MKAKGIVQESIYARFVDRLMEIGAYGEIEAVHEYWEDQNVASTDPVEAVTMGYPELKLPQHHNN
jgi:capsule polysaccharide export protein KpsE/RkpR